MIQFTLVVYKMYRLLLVLVFSPACFALYETWDKTPCPTSLSLALPSSILLANGSLLTGGLEFPFLFPPGTFWRHLNGHYYGCPCLLTPCIRVCQEDVRSKRLLTDEDELPFFLRVTDHNGRSAQNVDAHGQFTVLTGKTCPKEEWHVLFPDQYKLYGNGSLLNILQDNVYTAEQFCFLVNANTSDTLALFCGPPRMKSMQKCDESSTCFQLRTAVVFICFVVSLVFLILTLAAYAVVPALRSLHGANISAYCVCHMLAYFGYSAIRRIYFTGLGEVIPKDWCVTLGYLTYFFLESSFLWLNVMCFDIWTTFRRDFVVNPMLTQSHKKKFLAYCAYAFIIPLVLTAVLLSIDLTKFLRETWRPNIGQRKGVCWFPINVQYWIYADSFILLLLIVNLFFFISTAINIYRAQKETSLILGQRHSNEEKSRFKMYLNLFLVTGISWIMDAIQSVSYERFWYFTDVMSVLQSILIFVVCVWTTKHRESFLRNSLPSVITDRFSKHPTTPSPARSPRITQIPRK